MFATRHALPLDRRTEARLLLPDELIAAVSQRPAATTRVFIDTWLATVEWIACERGPIVFDWFVVGSPAPVLLEIAHELREVRRAELRGEFDGEEEHWYDEHPDDDAIWEPPTVPERVVAALDDRPGIGLLATRLDVQQIIASRLRLGPHELIDTIEIDLTFSLLLADVAEVARLGDLVVASGLLRGERHRIGRVA